MFGMILGVRAANACLRCRRAKTKCLRDSDSQPCRSCLKSHHECVFSERKAVRKRRAVEDPSTAVPTRAPRVASPAGQGLGSAGERLSPTVVDQCQRTLFKSLCPWGSFHQPSFQRQLRDGNLEPSLYYAMLASCGRASSELIHTYGSSSAASDHFARRAMAFAFEALDHSSIQIIQAVHLVILHEWGSRKGSRAFVYIAMAIRMIQMLKPVNHTDDDFVVAETARRALWTFHLMEQLLNGDRPTILNEKDLQISLPCPEQDFHFGTRTVVPMLNGNIPPDANLNEKVGEIGEFGYLILIARVWRRVVSWIFESPSMPEAEVESKYQELLAALVQWQKLLPARLQNCPGQIDLHSAMGTGFPFAFIHCVYHLSLIFLNRKRLLRLRSHPQNHNAHLLPSLPNKSIADSIDSLDAIDTIYSSASAITALLTALEASTETSTVFPIFMLFSSFTAATTVAYMSMREFVPVQQRAHAYAIVRDNLKILGNMRDCWRLAEEWYTELVDMTSTLRSRDRDAEGSDVKREERMPDDQQKGFSDGTGSEGAMPDNSSLQAQIQSLVQPQSHVSTAATPAKSSTVQPSPLPGSVASLIGPPADDERQTTSSNEAPSPAAVVDQSAVVHAYEELLASSSDLISFLGYENRGVGVHGH